MSLRAEVPRYLDWDPREEGADHEGSWVEWAVAHQVQERPDWCWAACARNALTCFGTFIAQERVARCYLRRFGGQGEALEEKWRGPWESGDQQRILGARHLRDFWRSLDFDGAEVVSGRLGVDALRRQLLDRGPVQIELGSGEGRPSHLVLVVGLREDDAGAEVRVSDPALPAITQWFPWQTLQGASPIPGHPEAGEWFRSYVGLEQPLSYLRRFFRRPMRHLPGGRPERPAVSPERLAAGNPSGLRPWWPEGDPVAWRGLRPELTLAAHGYGHYRRSRGWAPLSSGLFVLESFAVLEPERRCSGQGALRHEGLWHHQIWEGVQGGEPPTVRPRLYALTVYGEGGAGRTGSWRARWLGEAWLARRVERAIGELGEGWSGGAEPVAMVRWGGRNVYDFVTLWAMESDLHHVASVPEHLYRELRPGSRLSSEGMRRFARRATR